MERGYSPKTTAEEFFHEEFHDVPRGKHAAKNPKQAIAIGLSKARLTDIPVGPRAARKK